MNGVKASWSRFTGIGAAQVGLVGRRLMLRITKDPGIIQPLVNWIRPVASTTKPVHPGATRVVALVMMLH